MDINLNKKEFLCSEYFEYKYFDWYDFNKIEKLNERRSKQLLKLLVKFKNANKKKDVKAIAKAQEALKRHEKQDEVFKENARKCGYYWT